MKIKPIAHGTPGGYRRHLERKVEMCEPCRTAMNVYRRAYAEANPDKIAAKNYRGAARKRRLRDREAALAEAFSAWLRDERSGDTVALVDSRDTLWTLWDLKFPSSYYSLVDVYTKERIISSLVKVEVYKTLKFLADEAA